MDDAAMIRIRAVEDFDGRGWTAYWGESVFQRFPGRAALLREVAVVADRCTAHGRVLRIQIHWEPAVVVEREASELLRGDH